MANYEPMPFVRKFGGSSGEIEPSTTLKTTVDSGFVGKAVHLYWIVIIWKGLLGCIVDRSYFVEL